MQHYFGTVIDGKASIQENQLHHLLDVRRARVGEMIEVSAEDGTYLCRIVSLEPLEIETLEKLEERRSLDIEVTIAFALLKGDHNELIVLKGTELGVSAFIPFLSERCIVRPDAKEDNRLLRLRKKAEEGALQCRREDIPVVEPYCRYDEVLALPYDYRYIAYEGEAGHGASLLDECQAIPEGSRVLVLIGPEGGFTEEEAEKAKAQGFRFVSLGRRILRAETAALFAASVLSAVGEK